MVKHDPVLSLTSATEDEERETNKMQLIRCLLSNFYLNTFRASLCPSSGEQECALPYMVFCTGCGGCGCVELGRELCALFESNSNFHSHKSDDFLLLNANVPTVDRCAPKNYSMFYNRVKVCIALI